MCIATEKSDFAEGMGVDGVKKARKNTLATEHYITFANCSHCLDSPSDAFFFCPEAVQYSGCVLCISCGCSATTEVSQLKLLASSHYDPVWWIHEGVL